MPRAGPLLDTGPRPAPPAAPPVSREAPPAPALKTATRIFLAAPAGPAGAAAGSHRGSGDAARWEQRRDKTSVAREWTQAELGRQIDRLVKQMPHVGPADAG